MDAEASSNFPSVRRLKTFCASAIVVGGWRIDVESHGFLKHDEHLHAFGVLVSARPALSAVGKSHNGRLYIVLRCEHFEIHANSPGIVTQ